MNDSSNNSLKVLFNPGILSAGDYVYITAEFLNGLFAILGNGLVMLAMWQCRHLRTLSNSFIGNLALVDALSAVANPAIILLTLKGLPQNFNGCLFANIVMVFIANVSVLAECSVAIERYLAISDPYRYIRVMTKTTATIMNVMTWVVGILVSLLPLVGWHKKSGDFDSCSGVNQIIDIEYLVYVMFFAVYIPLLVLKVAVYLYIYRAVQRIMRQNELVMRVLVAFKGVRLKKSQVRGAKGLAYVITLFVICWVPLHTVNSITLFAPQFSPGRSWLLATSILSHTNSTFNTFLYACSNTKFVSAMLRIVCRTKHNLEQTLSFHRSLHDAFPRNKRRNAVAWPTTRQILGLYLNSPPSTSSIVSFRSPPDKPGASLLPPFFARSPQGCRSKDRRQAAIMVDGRPYVAAKLVSSEPAMKTYDPLELGDLKRVSSLRNFPSQIEDTPTNSEPKTEPVVEDKPRKSIDSKKRSKSKGSIKKEVSQSTKKAEQKVSHDHVGFEAPMAYTGNKQRNSTGPYTSNKQRKSTGSLIKKVPRGKGRALRDIEQESSI